MRTPSRKCIQKMRNCLSQKSPLSEAERPSPRFGKASLDPVENTVRVNTGEVQESGDWAYEVGTFTASAPDGAVLNAGKYVVIWNRQVTGEWKTHRDIFNWD